MTNYTLEVCVDSVEAACIAYENGATRLEVCSNLVIGGTTPSVGLLKAIKDRVTIPTHVLIRPRFGDFLYSKEEAEVMYHDIEALSFADGFVIGALDKYGHLDTETMNYLLKATNPKRVTLHRCIDMCESPIEELRKAAEMGISTVLTSGTYASAREGLGELEKFQRLFPELEILVGAGVNSSFIKNLEANSCLRHFHMSGKVVKQSDMEYRNSRVSMGLPSLSEYEIYTASGKEISECSKRLRERFE